MSVHVLKARFAQSDLDDYLTSYLGHGHDDANWIFVSIEESGLHCSAQDRIDYWLNIEGKSQTVDARDKEDYLYVCDPSTADIYGRRNKKKPAGAPYLTHLEKIVVATEIGPTAISNKSQLHQIRRDRTGAKSLVPPLSSIHSIALLELHPLPHKRSRHYDYPGMDVPQNGTRHILNTRSDYTNWCLSNRIQKIVTWISNGSKRASPLRVVVLGSSPEMKSLRDAIVLGLAGVPTPPTHTFALQSQKYAKNPAEIHRIPLHIGHAIVAQYVHPLAHGVCDLDILNLASYL